jgi:hypothetical protein
MNGSVAELPLHCLHPLQVPATVKVPFLTVDPAMVTFIVLLYAGSVWPLGLRQVSG